MKIKVTDLDIHCGKPNNSRSCPVAVSLKRHGFYKTDVAYSFIKINDLILETPKEVRSFLYGYDLYNKASAFEFELKLPRKMFK